MRLRQFFISIINVLRVNSHQAKAKAKLFFEVCQFSSMFFTFVFHFPRCKWTHLMGVSSGSGGGEGAMAPLAL